MMRAVVCGECIKHVRTEIKSIGVILMQPHPCDGCGKIMNHPDGHPIDRAQLEQEVRLYVYECAKCDRRVPTRGMLVPPSMTTRRNDRGEWQFECDPSCGADVKDLKVTQVE